MRRSSLGRLALLAAVSVSVVVPLAFSTGASGSPTNARLPSGALATARAGYLPPVNPPANVAPLPDYTYKPGALYSSNDLPVCWASFTVTQPNSADCIAAEVAATDRAHRLEKLAPIQLPTNWLHLSADDQLLVIADIERVSRGESPVIGLSTRADAFAARGAATNTDPMLPKATGIAHATGGYASNWAGSISTLDANYDWMYVDGWGGKATFNYDCTGPHATGCWGHRDNILTDEARMRCITACELVMGAGFVRDGFTKEFSSYAEIFVQVAGGLPPMTYTWRQAVAAGARA